MQHDLHIRTQQLFTLLAAVTLGACSGGGTTVPPPSEPALETIEVSSDALMVVKGQALRLRADGTYDDGTVERLRDVTWSSSDTAVATIDEVGLLTAVAAGTTDISAAVGSVRGTVSVTVTGSPLRTIAVQPGAVGLVTGETEQLTAMGTLADGTTLDITNTVTWSSTNEAAATVDAGFVTAVAAGTANIIARDPGTSVSSGPRSAEITVVDPEPTALDVMPTSVSLEIGATAQLTATLTYDNASTEDVTESVSWTSSDEDVATIDAAGLVTGVAPGSTTISARHEASGIRDILRVTVTPPVVTAITVAPTSVTLELIERQVFQATATFSDGAELDFPGVQWSSSDPSIATVSNMSGERGLVRPVAAGTVTITAVDAASGVSSADSNASATVTVVSPSVASVIVVAPDGRRALDLAAGLVQPVRAFAIYSDNSGVEITNTVTWSSSDPAFATVDAMGNVTAVAEGEVVISATDPASGLSSDAANQSLPITVEPPDLIAIQVTPSAVAMIVGTTQQFTATGVYTDGVPRDLSTVVDWTSSSPSLLTISGTGLATAVANGNVTIDAADPTTGVSSGDTMQSATVLISNANLVSIAVTPTTNALPVGATVQLQAMGTYDNAAVVDLTNIVQWSSSDAMVADVSNAPGARGVVRAIAAGSITINASEAISGVSSADSMESATITVPAGVTLTSLTVAPATNTFNVNQSVPYTVEGTFSDASTHPMTETVLWTSSAPTIANVSNTEGTRGLVTGLDVGVATITAVHTPTGVSSATTNTSGSATVEQGIEIGDLVHFELDEGSGTTLTNLAPGGGTVSITGPSSWGTPGGAPGTSTGYLTMPSGSTNHVNANLATTTYTNLTIDFWYRYQSGTGLGYMWNSSVSFRAFTNGVANAGIYVRETPGGTDIVYTPSIQDGMWHHFAYVLDASAGTGTLYVDGVVGGMTSYNGTISIPTWYLMGQNSSNGTTSDYDRFRVWSIANSATEVADMVAGNR
ncbi:MAG: Ig-like domain-containing protein [Deltaproteobacteria bacterium]